MSMTNSQVLECDLVKHVVILVHCTRVELHQRAKQRAPSFFRFAYRNRSAHEY